MIQLHGVAHCFIASQTKNIAVEEQKNIEQYRKTFQTKDVRLKEICALWYALF
jgi:hypothetical protein